MSCRSKEKQVQKMKKIMKKVLESWKKQLYAWRLKYKKPIKSFQRV